jgi:hypothetical protein
MALFSPFSRHFSRIFAEKARENSIFARKWREKSAESAVFRRKMGPKTGISRQKSPVFPAKIGFFAENGAGKSILKRLFIVKKFEIVSLKNHKNQQKINKKSTKNQQKKPKINKKSQNRNLPIKFAANFAKIGPKFHSSRNWRFFFAPNPKNLRNFIRKSRFLSEKTPKITKMI